MGGIFGVCSREECIMDLFFGTDYHSHLGTKRGGMAVFDGKHYTRAIHNIENSPFRTKFEQELGEMTGNTGVGCISDSNPQPIIMSSRLGTLAVVTVGRINNKNELVSQMISEGNAYFTEMSGGSVNDTELVVSLICQKNCVAEGIKYAQSRIEGSMTMIVSADGGLYAARDRLGRTPLSIGKSENGGYCASLESFAYINLGFRPYKELGPGEVVFITAEKVQQVFEPQKEMKMCVFMWMYYGSSASDYEGRNAEEVRYKCGGSLALQEMSSGIDGNLDYVAGVPDSGTPHAIGYANKSHLPFARPLIKYTPTWPRSFTPKKQSIRSQIARMKLIPISALIRDKRLLLVEDSIVRGTQMMGLMDYLFGYGAKELHMRVACPPVMYNCKYLNFTGTGKKNEAITRQTIMKLEGIESADTDLDDGLIAQYTNSKSDKYRNMVEEIRKTLNFTTLEYHNIQGMLDCIGLDKCRLCTYCLDGECGCGSKK